MDTVLDGNDTVRYSIGCVFEEGEGNVVLWRKYITAQNGSSLFTHTHSLKQALHKSLCTRTRLFTGTYRLQMTCDRKATAQKKMGENCTRTSSVQCVDREHRVHVHTH